MSSFYFHLGFIILSRLSFITVFVRHTYFRSGHSCSTQLLKLMEDFNSYSDVNDISDCIYLDFGKTFDRLSHNILGY